MRNNRALFSLVGLLAIVLAYVPSGHAIPDRAERPRAGNRKLTEDLRVLRPIPPKVHSISNVILSPSLPASLSHGEEVNITFSYFTSHQGKVRIFLCPMTGGRPSPGYGVSGSPSYPKGKGSGTGFFTIRKGDVMIDGIRFEIKTDDQKKLLHSQIIPVKYRFSDDPFRGATAGASTYHIRPDGVLEITNADGSVVLYDSEGHRGFRDPATGKEGWFHIDAIDLEPPVAADEPDAAWIESLNKWLDNVGKSMLGSIEQLAANPNSFNNYKEHENEKCENLYQRVDMRRRFLGVLVEKLK